MNMFDIDDLFSFNVNKNNVNNYIHINSLNGLKNIFNCLNNKGITYINTHTWLPASRKVFGVKRHRFSGYYILFKEIFSSKKISKGFKIRNTLMSPGDIYSKLNFYLKDLPFDVILKKDHVFLKENFI